MILIATKNIHKAQELAALSSGWKEVLNLSQWEEKNSCSLAQAEETGQTFIENALIKARYYAKITGLPTLADDSGLSVDFLDGAPGIYSARYGGPGLDDKARFELLLRDMGPSHDRRAYFTSVLALAKPSGEALYWEGRAYGLISRKAMGENGFGYDPIFYYPPLLKTFAQLSAEEKNKVSHRARAASLFQQDADRAGRFLMQS